MATDAADVQQGSEDDPMQTESSSAESTNGADEATSSSGDDVDMTSPIASLLSSMDRLTAMMLLQPGSPSALFLPVNQAHEHHRRGPIASTNTEPASKSTCAAAGRKPNGPNGHNGPNGPIDATWAVHPIPFHPTHTTQALSQHGGYHPPIPGAEQGPLNFARPMAREDIRGRQDEVMEALDFPDAVQDMARELWSNNCNAEEAFPVDVAVEFSAGNMSSVDLDFGWHGKRGPVAPIDPHHDAPLVEAFTKYYNQWVQLHLKRRRELLAELMLLCQMEGLDDLIKCVEGLDAEWMRDQEWWPLTVRVVVITVTFSGVPSFDGPSPPQSPSPLSPSPSTGPFTVDGDSGDGEWSIEIARHSRARLIMITLLLFTMTPNVHQVLRSYSGPSKVTVTAMEGPLPAPSPSPSPPATTVTTGPSPPLTDHHHHRHHHRQQTITTITIDAHHHRQRPITTVNGPSPPSTTTVNGDGDGDGDGDGAGDGPSIAVTVTFDGPLYDLKT
ncbi:hypothetical protein BDN67DRAFT_985436 [Paxillus ammoniavirescens]|nr:hypothetical protein BDN67DRAFT_985436 [Paxillus ammoniavirescens]